MATEIPLDSIKPDTPIRLELAAQLAFPGGGITAASLRTEARKGRLVVESIAGKDFTTLREVEEMRRLCQKQKASGSGSDPSERVTRPSGSSETETARKALAAARAIVRKLSEKNSTR